MLNLQYDQEAEFRAIRKEAKEEGREESVTKMVKSLLQDQLPIEFISKHTGLSAQEVEKLKAATQKVENN